MPVQHINYKKFIEDNFLVLDREEQTPIPFKLNPVQEKYYEILQHEYEGLEGVREIILKARQEGMSSFVLALFTVDFLLRPYSVSICISHRKDSTELLFKKVKFYIECYLKKLAEKQKVPYETIEKEFLLSNNKNLIENKLNKASFYIGTAGAKVGGRGGSAKNVHFSEAAFYQDTDLITAREIVVGTAQQVPQGKGMIFIESTANGENGYYHETWEQAERGESIYKPRFFGWQEFYTEEWVNQKRKEFPNEQMWAQEYPVSPDAAFITSGSPYFDVQLLNEMLKRAPNPLMQGRFAPDGSLDHDDGPNATVHIYREPEYGEQFVVFADPADARDYCAAVACSKKRYDFPIVMNAIMESSQFGYDLYAFCKYIFTRTGMWPKLAVERNTGQATIYVLKTMNYQDLFRMVDFTSQGGSYEKGQVGWLTTGHLHGGELQGTRRKMLDDFSLALKQNQITLYDPTQIKQLKSFVIIKGRAQARSNKKDDLVMASAGAWQIHLLTPSVDFGFFDEETFKQEKSKWRFR